MAKDFADDFSLDANGDLNVVDGDDALAQRLKKRLCTQETEWAFDLQFGIPWLYQVLGASIDAASTRSLVTEALEEDFEVNSVSGLEVDTDRRARKQRLSARVQSVSGAIIQVN